MALAQKESFVFSKYERCIIFYIQRSHESTVMIADGVQFGSIKRLDFHHQRGSVITSDRFLVFGDYLYFFWQLSDCL